MIASPRAALAAVVTTLLFGCASVPKAAHGGDVADVEKFLANGGTVNARFDDGGCDDCTLLHVAADGGQVAVARLLIDRGADVNALAAHARRPLHYAVGGQSAPMVTLLLQHGAAPSVEARDEWGNTPLLIAAGTVKVSEGWTVTPVGAVAGSSGPGEPSAEVIDALLAAGAKVNLASSKGNTPLHIAASRGHVRTVKVLLARGADPALRNLAGETAEQLAARLGKSDVVAALRATR